MMDTKEIGKIFANARKEKDLTPGQLAKGICDESIVYFCENGFLDDVPTSHFILLAGKLDILEQLFPSHCFPQK